MRPGLRVRMDLVGGRQVLSPRTSTAMRRNSSKRLWLKWSRGQARNSAVYVTFENQTTQDRETHPPISPRSARRILRVSKILSLQFPLRPLFPVKSSWALGCTTRDQCSAGTQHSRDREVVKRPDR